MFRLWLIGYYLGLALGLDSVFERIIPKRKPGILYKYLSPERASIFKDDKIRFSQFNALNDPLEFGITISDKDLDRMNRELAAVVNHILSAVVLWRLPFRMAKPIMTNEHFNALPAKVRAKLLILLCRLWLAAALNRSVRLGSPHAEEMQQTISDFIRVGMFNDGVLVFSCSELSDSIPMWAHYTSNHSGFQIGFDPYTAFIVKQRKGEPEYIKPLKIKYVRAIPKGNKGVASMRLLGVVKLGSWSYEREWRYSLLKDRLDDPEEFDGKGLAVYKQPIEADAIREITFGYLCSKETIEQIIDLCRDKYPNVKFWTFQSDGKRYPYVAAAVDVQPDIQGRLLRPPGCAPTQVSGHQP